MKTQSSMLVFMKQRKMLPLQLKKGYFIKQDSIAELALSSKLIEAVCFNENRAVCFFYETEQVLGRTVKDRPLY
jgi:hypothetical protein